MPFQGILLVGPPERLTISRDRRYTDCPVDVEGRLKLINVTSEKEVRPVSGA